MYVDTKDLPEPIREALTAVGYGRSNIRVQASATVALNSSGSHGSRAFTVLVNLTTGVHRIERGSWGGPNMFTDNAVDTDAREYALPTDGVAIKGSQGGGEPVYATLHVPASMVDRILPGASEQLSRVDLDTLYCHASITGGQYRRDEMTRRGVTPADVDRAVERGWIKRNRAGACQITTAGRNALGDYRGH